MSLRMLISGAFLSVINCLIHNINCKHFKLYIYEEEAILRDINKNKYYILKQEGTHGTDRSDRR